MAKQKRIIMNSDGDSVSKTDFRRQGWFRYLETRRRFGPVNESDLLTIPLDEWLRPDFDLQTFEDIKISELLKAEEDIQKYFN
mgnify:CR=1 FL=1